MASSAFRPSVAVWRVVARIMAGLTVLVAAGAVARPHASEEVAARVRINSLSTAAQRNVDVTFGQPFGPGEVPAGRQLFGRLDSGIELPAQLDVKATYPDGSVRFGVVTMRVPALSSRTVQTVAVVARQGSVSSSPVSLDDLLASDFEALAVFEVDGIRYRASARQSLRQGDAQKWLEGPLASEWIVGGPIVDDEGGAHPHLAAYFHVRAYAGEPLSRVRVDVVVENGWARVRDPGDLTYDVSVQVTGRPAGEWEHVRHFHHARWHRVHWWGAVPEAVVTHDPHDLQASLATPRYAALAPTAKAFDSLPTVLPGPMDNLDLDDRLGRSGAAPWIGPMPRWDTLYAISGDVRAHLAVRAYADAWSAYPVHYRDERTGRPVNLAKDGNAFAGVHGAGRADFPAPVSSTSPYVWKSSHSPPAGFMAYVATGDFFYLEQVQFVAIQNLLQEITVGSSRYPSTWPRVIHSRQVRAQAWTLRTLGLAAAYTPDRDPLKEFLSAAIEENLRYLHTFYPASNNLGLLIREKDPFNYDTLGPDTGFAPWQHNFYTFAIGRLVELGFDDARPVMEFVTRWHRGALIGSEFCWAFAVNYDIGVRPHRGAPLFNSFREVYEANVPAEIRSLPCASPEMAKAIGKPEGAFNDYLDSPTSYQANQQPAVAMMATLGISGGKEAWALINSRTHRPRFDNYPNFAVVPR